MYYVIESQKFGPRLVTSGSYDYCRGYSEAANKYEDYSSGNFSVISREEYEKKYNRK